MNFLKTYTILFFLSLIIFIGCDDDKSGDVVPPSQVTDIQFIPLNGGGYFTYKIPNDPDFLYVKATYTLDSGKEVSKTSSTYNDTLYIEGFGSEKEYEVRLYSIDRNGNASPPTIRKIVPMKANILAVIETVTVKAGFSSLVVNWKNELKQTMDVYVTVKTEGKEATKVQSSNLPVDYFSYPNLEGKPHEVSVYIKDTYGNQTEVVPIGTFTPMKDGKISKKQWSFLNDVLLYGNKWDFSSGTDASKQKPYKQYQGPYRADSIKNAREVNLEGSVWKFFDDIIDDRIRLNLNYFHTGSQLCPFSYFIDMGRTIKASRFRYWQRDASTQYYAGENVQTFQLWISDDADPSDGIFDGWELVGTYTIIKPSDAVEAENMARIGHEFLLYQEDPRFTKPFRYLRYKAIKYFNSTAKAGCASEITLYGTEKDGSISQE